MPSITTDLKLTQNLLPSSNQLTKFIPSYISLQLKATIALISEASAPLGTHRLMLGNHPLMLMMDPLILPKHFLMLKRDALMIPKHPLMLMMDALMLLMHPWMIPKHPLMIPKHHWMIPKHPLMIPTYLYQSITRQDFVDGQIIVSWMSGQTPAQAQETPAQTNRQDQIMSTRKSGHNQANGFMMVNTS